MRTGLEGSCAGCGRRLSVVWGTTYCPECAARAAGERDKERATRRRQQNRRAFRRERVLMRYFGLCSGSRQLAGLTGLSPDELRILLVADAEWSDNCARGKMASELCDLPTRLDLAKKARGNVAFWYGVAESTPARAQIGGAA